MQVPREDNPYLGWRSIRISLEMPEFFKVQLRAILRAAALGRVRIMFPMISSVEEIRRAKELLEEAREELVREGVEFEAGVQVGMMVEVPSAVALANQLIREVDFFSIGTNDLTQYTLAAERGNDGVAALADALHPAVLRLIEMTAAAARDRGIDVGVCGELASDVDAVPILLGLGVGELSVAPPAVPRVKAAVRGVDLAPARELARRALTCATAAEVRGLLG
jgi:phosphoenolpyruvate-protein kinase (PTS system EI component)